MQVVLVYLQPFHHNLLMKCALQPKIAKKFTKARFWGFKVVQGHQCLQIQCLLWYAANLYLSATVFTL